MRMHSLVMEFKDDLMSFCDWDPFYLSRIFDIDFNDFTELWKSNMMDAELVFEAINWRNIVQL